MRRGEAVEGEQVLLGGFEQLRDLRQRAAEAPDHLAQVRLGLLCALGVEDLAQRRRDQAALTSPAVPLHVADEVHGAALPGAGEDPRDRCLEPLVVVRDAKADAGEAA